MASIHAVESVLRDWDPIAVAPGEFAPADEYDSYAPHIVSMLVGGATVEDLAAHLEHVRTVTIGVPANREGDIACAEKLVAWWKEQIGQA